MARNKTPSGHTPFCRDCGGEDVDFTWHSTFDGKLVDEEEVLRVACEVLAEHATYVADPEEETTPSDVYDAADILRALATIWYTRWDVRRKHEKANEAGDEAHD